MTTLAHKNTVSQEIPKLALVEGQKANSDNSGSLTQGGMNPAAIAMSILYKVMGLYSEITGIQAEQQITEIKAQNAMAIGESKSIISAGNAQGASMIVGACLSIGTSLVGLGLTTLGTVESNKAATKTAEITAQVKPLREIDRIDSEITDLNPTIGEIPADVTNRAQDLESGIYSGKESEAELNKDAITLLKQDPERYQSFRDSFDRKLSTYEQRLLSTATGGQQAFQKLNTIAQTISSTGQAASSLSQGIGQVVKAKQDSNAALQRTSAQLAAQAASSQADASRKAGDAQKAAADLISAIRRSSSAA